MCLKVGPVGFEGSSLSRAKAELDTTTGSWKVAVAIKGSEKGTANELFNACYSGTPECPTEAGRPSSSTAGCSRIPPSRARTWPTNRPSRSPVTSASPRPRTWPSCCATARCPVEFERSAEQQVSPTLGRASLEAGLLAGLIGLAAVAIYMLIYYRGLGLVVILGLGVWSALMYSVICFLSARSGLALSLAGVTGIIVSVGTTVDSYVVYFERLKDEVKSGKTLRSSTERGFQRAFRTILTADVSSFIGAFVLWWLTVGPVRGFAFFLGLSVDPRRRGGLHASPGPSCRSWAAAASSPRPATSASPAASARNRWPPVGGGA